MGTYNALPRVELTCAQCGRQFSIAGSKAKPYGSRGGTVRRYCSTECFNIGRRIPVPTFECAKCGKVTVYKKSRKGDGSLGSYNRAQRFCSRSCAVSAQPRTNKGWRDKGGYRVMSKDGDQIAEHRLVMETMLGRRLLPGENVHHRDGNKQNNHPSNLELWIRAQPAGQRVSDKVQWAIDLLKKYPEFAEALGFQIVSNDEASIIRKITTRSPKEKVLNKSAQYSLFRGVP